MTDAERQEVADAPIGQLRDQFGIDHQVPKYLQDSWDEHSEGTLLATFATNGVAPAAVKEVVEYYVGHFTGALGQVAPSPE